MLRAIDGTPPRPVTDSRCASATASRTSHLWSITSFIPLICAPTIPAIPPTWKSGAATIVPGSAAAAGGRREINASRAVANPMFMRFAMVERLVPIAPLGRPVVPDV